ncbi:hypothetical protein HMPREF2086_01888 [Helicobacter macacae MIT 99-5501]|uniref:Uncharacterized protein n=1 Tax=Helicobacter macacae MIT 99-5501 TaxID=1357400 RepID=V8C5Y2_9HELI|nr:hypothetical protein HMPREF2086_01888 [Helicobacter macacae MIT 99-5501]
MEGEAKHKYGGGQIYKKHKKEDKHNKSNTTNYG